MVSERVIENLQRQMCIFHLSCHRDDVFSTIVIAALLHQKQQRIEVIAIWPKLYFNRNGI